MTTRSGVAAALNALLSAVVFAASAHAQARAPQLPVTVGTAGGDVTIVADRLEEVGPQKVLVATGNVEITRGASRLMADRVELNRETGEAVAQGRVVFYDGEDQLVGQRIEYNLRTGTGVVYQAEGRAAPYYRISGERMERLGQSVYRVRKGTFTTCEADPPPWSFRFGAATADLEDLVYGTNASFWIKNVPLIPFFPFFAAAIRRERQTGFLFPRVGSSSSKGVFAEIPFYWALTDSQDATIAPLVYTERGAGLNAEYRYMLGHEDGGRFRGFLLYESERHGDARGVGSVRHDWTIADGLFFKADINAVTDDFVLEDYGDRLHQRSSQRVESNVFLTRRWSTWNVVGSLFTYQDLTNRRPVELHRLPDLNVQATRQPVPGIPGLLYEADATYVHFVRDVGSNGSRLDLHPRLSYPITPGGLFTVTPFVGGRVTAYDKTVVGTRRTRGVEQPIEITEDDPRVRRIAEAGSDFEMGISRVYPFRRWGYDALLHSIEPRARYTWMNGSDQSRLPLWSEDIDRIPAASRIEYSLTNRIRGRTVAPDGADPVRWEVLRFVVGHGYELQRGDLGQAFTTLILQPTDKLRLRTDASYDVERDQADVVSTDVSVVFPRTTAAVGHRYSQPGRVSFMQASITSDLSRMLAVRARTEFDVRTATAVENRFALDWRFQCWAITVEYVTRARRDDEIRFAVNLLGVGGPISTSMGLGALDGGGER